MQQKWHRPREKSRMRDLVKQPLHSLKHTDKSGNQPEVDRRWFGPKSGMIMSCQSGAFAISKFIAGVLSDRTNPRHVFIVGLLVGGIATVLFSTVPVSSILILCGLWFLNGVAQGCGWPSCAKIIRQRASPTQFGTLWSILSSSINVAGSLAPFISSYIVLHYGWRASVFTSGIISVLFALLGAFALQLSIGNEETCESSNTKKCKASATNNSSEGSFLDLLFDPFLIMLSASFLVVLGARTALATWGQLYLIEERGRSHYEGSAFASSIESGGLLGRITVGYVTDRLIQRYTSKGSSPLNIRLSVAVAFMLGSVPLLHALRVTVTEDSSNVWITFLGFMIGALLYGPISIIGIVSVESAPAHLSGSSNAIASLAGNIGAIISGFPCCYLAEKYSWSTVFFLIEVAIGVVSIVMFFLKNLRPKLLKHKKAD
ncbi:hypothetical protein JTE90_009962 [Oedothorax gibbosus]|uniref:Major facilitator superfamily (MFS) profile domain-containing protein n=1 Tax=Oedothorax gibbosus TaxID=931172 RepID=A0AAV6V8F1_9ARAC|nr:hypothetical protein JTE90_009962 [Oedothorax gibbosus]